MRYKKKYNDEEGGTGWMYGVSRGLSIGKMGVKSVTPTCWGALECPTRTRGPSGRAALMGRTAKPLASELTVGSW